MEQLRIFTGREEGAAERGKSEEGEERGCEAQEETGKGQLALDIRKCWQIPTES